MKFGQSFHLYQVPEWEQFYISYKQLKSLFKIALEKAFQLQTEPSFTELYECLSCNTSAISTYHNAKYEFLHRKETQLCKKYGIALHLSDVSGLEEVDQYELKDLLEALLELRNDLLQLQWYNRVNEHAVNRIYGKIERFCESPSHYHHDLKSRWIKAQTACETQCLKDIERLNRLVTNIRHACSYSPSGSTRRSLYLKNICDQQSPSLIYPSAAYCAIRADQAFTLAKLLEQTNLNNRVPRSHFQASLYGLLNFSVTCQSRNCTGFLLAEFPKNGVVIDQNCLNHLITVTGRSNMPANCENLDMRAHAPIDQKHSEKGISLFRVMLDQLGPSLKSVLRARDALGRHSLHYGALYGLTAICQSILDSLQEWEQDRYVAAEAIISVDAEGYTPLHSAVICNHTSVTKLFLDILRTNYGPANKVNDIHLRNVLAFLLLIALKSQSDDIVHLLLLSHVDIKHRYSRGETALYVAAQIGREDYVEAILKAVSSQDAYIDVPETVYGWTPLFIACAEGHLAVVKVLLQAGASQKTVDHLGWTAKEHAAFRGHLAVAEMLTMCRIGDPTGGPASTTFKTAVGANCYHQNGYSYIIVNLGTVQNGKRVTAVDLNCYSSENVYSLQAESRFSVEVSANGESRSSRILHLPVLDDLINEPFVFPIKNPDEAQLTFNIFCATSAQGKKGILVGSGTALLGNHSLCFGAKRESLIREHTVPILERETLNFMGTVSITFVIAKPFTHINTSPLIKHSIREAADPVQLVGHRGLGQNIASREYLQLGENTVESFLSAAKLGASFVEFDVQLTRDLVPVIYHDFSLSESGTDVPIHDLSLEQFMYASTVQSSRSDPVSALGRGNLQWTQYKTNQGRLRARSLTRERERGSKEVQNRMEHTVDFMNKGFKPNTRGDFIQDTFATLEELLVELPKSISFDVEIKYPRLHEAVEAGVAPISIELNTFIDLALDKIYLFGGDRTIILSSFTPEVCILLAIKQQRYPVMFITNAGKRPMTDMEMRAGSLKVAVNFAKHWKLSGIVFASETLILSPRLIKFVKNSGLSCASYGLLNNIPEHAKSQAEAGLDIIMADRVGLISKTLKGASI